MDKRGPSDLKRLTADDLGLSRTLKRSKPDWALAEAEAPAEPTEPPCLRCSGSGFYRRDVPPGDPDFGKAFACSCRTRQLDPYGARARGLTFETFVGGDAENAIAEKAWAWAQGRHWPWLAIYGIPGGGKTHLCYAAAELLGRRGEDVLLWNVADLVDELLAALKYDDRLRQTDNVGTPRFEPLYNRLKECGWLILDDAGAENATNWTDSKLYSICDQRYVSRLPLLITSNNPDSLPERVKRRLEDTSLCLEVVNEASDKRPVRGEP